MNLPIELICKILDNFKCIRKKIYLYKILKIEIPLCIYKEYHKNNFKHCIYEISLYTDYKKKFAYIKVNKAFNNLLGIPKLPDVNITYSEFKNFQKNKIFI